MATKTLLSLADYAALPDDGKRYELVKGELVERPFSKFQHSRVVSGLIRELGTYLQENPIGEIGATLGFILGRNPDSLRGPDAFFMTNERVAAIDPNDWVEGAPDLAIEVLEPGDDRDEARTKFACFLANGCVIVWMIDLEDRSARIIDRYGKETVLGEDDALTAPDLLPGFSISLREAFDI